MAKRKTRRVTTRQLKSALKDLMECGHVCYMDHPTYVRWAAERKGLAYRRRPDNEWEITEAKHGAPNGIDWLIDHGWQPRR